MRYLTIKYSFAKFLSHHIIIQHSRKHGWKFTLHHANESWHLYESQGPQKVELKIRSDTPDISNLQKCADFFHAFMLGFDVINDVALLHLGELYVESFVIKDVKTLQGEHLSCTIRRLSGKGGKTKFAIENSTKTRIVIADTKIHIL